jgi:hypothetical protein
MKAWSPPATRPNRAATRPATTGPSSGPPPRQYTARVRACPWQRSPPTRESASARSTVTSPPARICSTTSPMHRSSRCSAGQQGGQRCWSQLRMRFSARTGHRGLPEPQVDRGKRDVSVDSKVACSALLAHRKQHGYRREETQAQQSRNDGTPCVRTHAIGPYLRTRSSLDRCRFRWLRLAAVARPGGFEDSPFGFVLLTGTALGIDPQ